MTPEQLAELIEKVKILPLRASDVIVLKVPGTISLATSEKLKNQVSTQVGGHKVLVLSDGLDIDVLRKEL